MDCRWTGAVENYVVAGVRARWCKRWNRIRVEVRDLDEMDGCDEVVKNSSTGLVCIGCILDEDLGRDNEKGKSITGSAAYRVRVAFWVA